VVSQLPWLDQMSDCEESAKHDADAAHDDIGDAEKGILPSHDGTCGDDDRFGATVFGYWEVWGECEFIFSK
jgi:hypothetical protein